MKRSLRFELASRYAAAVALGIALVATIGYLVLRDTLDRQINASLISVASIQAASVTDDPTGEMHFHEWGVTAAEAESLGDLNRYAQIWSESGESLLRSQYLTHDLPLDERALSEAAAGEFADPEWAERWGIAFAQLYMDAFDAWERGEDVLTKAPIAASSVADSIVAGLPADRLKAMRAVKFTEGGFVVPEGPPGRRPRPARILPLGFGR